MTNETLEKFELLPEKDEKVLLKDRILQVKRVVTHKVSYQDIVTMVTHWKSELENGKKELGRVKKAITDAEGQIKRWEGEISQVKNDVPEISELMDKEAEAEENKKPQ